MSQRKSMFFEIVRVFPVIGGGEGVLFRDVRTPDGKDAFYVADRKDVSDATVGLFVEVPTRTTSEENVFRIPDHMTLVCKGPLEQSSASAAEAIRLLYLVNLYNGPLHATRRGTEKVFESTEVFATPILRLFESLHNLYSPTNLHAVLEATNYEFTRTKVFTRFHDADSVSYRTPRLLKYFPQENTVSVSYALGGTAKQVKIPSDKDADKHYVLDPAPVQVHISRLYVQKGWSSLRDLARQDPKLRAFIKMFYDNEYGYPCDPQTGKPIIK